MKISGRKPLSRTGSVKSAPRQDGKIQVDNAPGVESGAADVEFSESLQGIDRARAALATMPDVRVERVDAIKPRIEDGSYKVQSKVVAKKMVDSALRESARQRSGKAK